MTKEYVKYSGADVELTNNEGETLLIDNATSVEISGSKVYVTLATINENIKILIKGKEFALTIISPLTDVDSHEDSKLLKINYDNAKLQGTDVKFEHANSDGLTYKFDVSFGDCDISVVDNEEHTLVLLANKFTEQDVKIEQISNEMKKFRELVLNKLNELSKEENNKYGMRLNKDCELEYKNKSGKWVALKVYDNQGETVLETSEDGGIKYSGNIVNNKVDEILNNEYDTAKGLVTGGTIGADNPTTINLTLNIENLHNAKDLANSLSNELRTKGLGI